MNALSAVVLGAITGFSFSCTAAEKARRPNIILILTDDQGCSDIGRNNAIINTPNIDTFATESVRFSQFHVHSACAPTRASLMTGRNHQLAGVWGVHGGRDNLHRDEVIIPKILSEHGYSTVMFGKWHLGKTADRYPDQRGFDDQHLITGRLYGDTEPIILHNGKTSKPKGWTCDILTDRVIEFMRKNKRTPFFAYVAYPQIHGPWNVP